MNDITVLQLKTLIPGIKIIDIRDNYQYNLGNIPTSKNVPTNFLLTNPELYLNFEDTYYIYCEFGSTSSKTCEKLRSKGYKVINIIGGYNEYKRL
ncbi:MAG: rhodanese-like domain-containing protein [Bacilli bacterium]